MANKFGLGDLFSQGLESFTGAASVRLCSAPKLAVTDFAKEVVDTEREGRQLVAAASGGDDHECCKPVVDSTTWLAVIGGMAVVAYFLRLTIISTLGRKRRRRGLQTGLLMSGSHLDL